MGNLDHPTPSLFSMKLLLLVSLLTSFVFSVGLIGVTTNGEAIHTVDISSVPVQVGSTEVARIDNLDNSGDSWSAVAYDSANSRYLVAAKFGSSYKILSIGWRCLFYPNHFLRLCHWSYFSNGNYQWSSLLWWLPGNFLQPPFQCC